MTKRKFNKFVDVVTVLLILFPLLMALITARCSGTFDSSALTDYVQNFAISSSLADNIGECINTFGIAFDGAFFGSACVLISNAFLIYVFRVFIAVLTFIPKLALKFIDIDFGGKDI